MFCKPYSGKVSLFSKISLFSHHFYYTIPRYILTRIEKRNEIKKRIKCNNQVLQEKKKEKLPELSTYITGSDSKLRQLYYPHPANHHHEKDADTDVDADEVDHMLADETASRLTISDQKITVNNAGTVTEAK